MTIRWRGHHHFDRISVDDLVGYGAQIKGIKYYVDVNHGKDTDSGSGWDKAWQTITHALSMGGDNAIIIVGSGLYIEGATLAITQNELKLFGVMSSGMTHGQPGIHSHGTETLVTVNPTDVGMVEIANLGFHDQGAGKSLLIGDSKAAWRTHVHDCFFGGNGVALYGIDVGSLMDAPFPIIEDCYFDNYVTGCINQNAFYSMVRRCLFIVRTNQKGIIYLPHGAGRPQGSILSNKFVTTDSTDSIGVNVVNTPTPGMAMIDDNHFVGFGATKSIDATGATGKTGLMGLNYNGVTAVPIAT